MEYITLKNTDLQVSRVCMGGCPMGQYGWGDVQEKELLFTSGGTESNNLAILGCAAANHRMGKHLITTKIEHPSVGNVMKHMEEEGFEVTYLPVDRDGRVKLDALKRALCEDTILVSIMHVNNEMGAVQPIEEIGKIQLCHRTSSKYEFY